MIYKVVRRALLSAPARRAAADARFGMLVGACVLSAAVHAGGELYSQTTPLQIEAEAGKGVAHRARLAGIEPLIKARRFDDAAQLAREVCAGFEAGFDAGKQQYAFALRADFEAYVSGRRAAAEWIDWGYEECQKMQAFVAAERNDFAGALALLQRLERVAPGSAGVATETGYALSRLGRFDEALAAYRRALALTERFASQRAARPLALRGAGVTLIELKQFDEAERLLRESLDIEPGNRLALGELRYIEAQRTRP